MLNFKNKNIKKGQVFLISVLVLSAVFVLGVILITLYIRELKFSRESINSTKAFYAADAAMEWAMYEVFQQTSIQGPNNSSVDCLNLSNQSSCSGHFTDETTLYQIRDICHPGSDDSDGPCQIEDQDCQGLENITNCRLRTGGKSGNTARSQELNISQ